MPRTQALSFAIRTRPQPSASQSIPLLRQFFSSSSHNTTAKHLGLPTPTPIHLALFRRHLSTLHPRPRPQSNFLTYPSVHDKSLRACLDRFVRNRYLTTARKRRWRDTVRWQLRFHAYFWPMFFAAWLVYYGLNQIEMEHEYPTPPEWGFWARWEGRAGKCLLERYAGRGFASEGEWARAAEYVLRLLGRLEDQNGDGRGLREQEGGQVLIEGVGRSGFDLSGKSERWRQGYWEVLMGAAKIAEHLDGACKKKGEKLSEKTRLWRWENVPGPQNPRPVPAKWQKDGSHLNVPGLNEVEDAIEGPEVFYMRILTSKGFSNRQRLDAALAYADWADFKGLKETAANMYDWALDIAAGGLPEGANHVVNIQTGVINAGKEAFVSENLLKATTALGVWHARHGEVKEALPIFLSILRARKALPPVPAYTQMRTTGQKKAMTAAERESQTASGVIQGYFAHIVDFFTEPDASTIPTSGDEQPFHSLKEACEEVGIMTYIGEILFATSDKEREKGLSWTRDSVDAAEAVLWFMDEQGRDEEGRQRCRECLETGLANWQQMVRQMSRLAHKKKEEAQQSSGWLGLGIGQASAIDKAIEEVKRWEGEEAQIELRKKKTASLVSPLVPSGNVFGNSTVPG